MKNIHYNLFTLTSLLFVGANELYASKKVEKIVTTTLGVVGAHISEQVKKSSNVNNDESLKSGPLSIVSNTQSAHKSGSDMPRSNDEKPRSQVPLIKQNDPRLNDPHSHLFSYKVIETKGEDNIHDVSDQTYNAEPYSDEESDYEESVFISDDEDDQSPSDDEQTPTKQGRDTNYNPNNLEPLQPGAQENFNLKEKVKNRIQNLTPPTIQDSIENNNFTHKKILSKIKPDRTFPSIKQPANTTAGQPTPTPKEIDASDEESNYEESVFISDDEDDQSPSNDEQTPTTQGRDTNYNPNNLEPLQPGAQENFKENQQNPPHNLNSIPLPIQDDTKDTDSEVSCNEGVGNAEVWNASPPTPSQKRTDIHDENDCTIFEFNKPIKNQDFSPSNDKKNTHSNVINNKDLRKLEDQKKSPSKNSGHVNANSPHLPIRHSNNLMIANKSGMNGMSAKEVSDFLRKENKKKRKGQKYQIKRFRNKGNAPREKSAPKVNKTKPRKILPVSFHSDNPSICNREISSSNPNKSHDKKHKKPASKQNAKTHVNRQGVKPVNSPARYDLQKSKTSHATYKNPYQKLENHGKGLNDRFSSYRRGDGNLQNDRLDDPYTDYNLIDDGRPIIESTIQTKGFKEHLSPSHQKDNSSYSRSNTGVDKHLNNKYLLKKTLKETKKQQTTNDNQTQEQTKLDAIDAFIAFQAKQKEENKQLQQAIEVSKKEQIQKDEKKAKELDQKFKKEEEQIQKDEKKAKELDQKFKSVQDAPLTEKSAVLYNGHLTFEQAIEQAEKVSGANWLERQSLDPTHAMLTNETGIRPEKIREQQSRQIKKYQK